MRNKFVASLLSFLLMVVYASAITSAAPEDGASMSTIDLSQYIYSYGSVIRVGEREIVLQEYDYDSDVEKEVSYIITAETKFEGFVTLPEVLVEDIVEVYYNEENGQRIAKIIHREFIDDELLIEFPQQ